MSTDSFNDRAIGQDGVQSQAIDRSTSGLPNIASSGFHMPPEILGVPTTTNLQQEETQEPPRQSFLADVNARSRKRSGSAVRGTKSKAAIEAAARAVKETGENTKIALDSSIFTLITYAGTEVVFANTNMKTVVGVCTRTHFLFQTVTLASAAPIISISSNSQSGMLIVAHEDGVVQTYRPVPTKPCEFGESNRDQIPRSAFGRFRWVDSCTIDASKTFYQEGETVTFLDRRSAKPGHLLDISSSTDSRVLIAHRKQLAVFEASMEGETNGDATTSSSIDGDATLLWTTLLPSNIVTSKISGDGQAVVVVLDIPNETGAFGAMTFVRDMEDGGDPRRRPSLRRNSSTGMVYKPGPFLEHSTPVTRISFRGLGRETSTLSEDAGQGNDLLLTYCETDSSNRIFNQNSWQQLMFWSAPPNSRADWIRGTSAFSLGDLESQKKIKNTPKHSRRPSDTSIAESSGGAMNFGNRNVRSVGLGPPTTSAGAWIAEITFRGAFPALRLSRLSYMKRGNDDSQPAHFESVAAVLPAGSIIADSVLKADDMGLVIQGVWPAWNPWLSESTAEESSDSLSGSAMQFLGLSSVPPPTSAFGDSYLGGSLTPPTELRIAASHPREGNLVLMEFPLWGDEEFGAMELGSPIRNVLSLSDAHSANHTESGDQTDDPYPSASMEYGSSRLCARIDSESNSISLLWRKAGSMSLYSPDWREDEDITATTEAGGTQTTRLLHDMSIIPAPLALPPLYLPLSVARDDRNRIVALKWWPDASFAGPPLLVAITKSGTCIVFEIAPPWCATEPTMPNHDPFNAPLYSDSVSINGMNNGGYTTSAVDDEQDLAYRKKEYIAKVTPHPDFGLGLRLESPMDGTPAVAGSFKKHPLNGGMLPAEKTGIIILGDELLSVNRVSLESMTFDDIIATVRHVGAKSGPGEALELKFRPAPLGRSKGNSIALQESLNAQALDSSMRTDSDPLSGGGSQKKRGEMRTKDDDDDDRSLGSVLLQKSCDIQQEFGRLIGVVRECFPSTKGHDMSQLLLLLPWSTVQDDSPVLNNIREAALIIIADGGRLLARRLEVPLEAEPGEARIVDLGEHDCLSEGISKKDGSHQVRIQNVTYIESGRESLSFAVSDSLGNVRLVFFKYQGSDSASFSHFSAFSLDSDAADRKICPSSVNLIATVPIGSSKLSQTITIWSPRPDPSCRRFISESALTDEYYDQDYIPMNIEVDSSDWNSSIRDCKFLPTGHLDHLPALIVFMKSESIVYQRGKSLKWYPIVRLTYPSIPDSSLGSCRSANKEILKSNTPCEIFPHILSSLRATLSSHDEVKACVSDWHPESLLTYLFTDERGAETALKLHVRGILIWLSEWIESSSDEQFPSVSSPLFVAPFDAVGGPHLLEKDLVLCDSSVEMGNAEMLIASFVGGSNAGKAEEKQRAKLQTLCTHLEKRKLMKDEINTAGRSKEFKQAMLEGNNYGFGVTEATFPRVLSSLKTNEIRTLWALAEVAMNPPNFRKLDSQAQLALMAFSLHAAIKKSPIEEISERSTKKRHATSFYVKKQPSAFSEEKTKLPPQNSSAGCAAALFSDYQGHLLESLRQPGTKLDWYVAREVRLPFWLRSDDSLRAISEEIGQSLYRESRDILKSSLFFILAGKKKMLRNLAAADNSASGRKFYKFLSDFDFSSPRGRSAAEKNAFSLLRKNRYDSAAAFFLLAEPPFLKSAVETIASKMGDIDLAFLVARLLGNQNSSPFPNSGVGLGGGMMGFGSSVLGGGGGYAGAGIGDHAECAKDINSFTDWKPELSKIATDLLTDRGLPESFADSAFSAVQLMWLGRQDEASHWLSGFLGSQDGLFPSFAIDVTLPRLDHGKRKKGHSQTIQAANSFINFVAGPLLLKMMRASNRTMIASSLLVSNSLARLGFELPCLRLISQNLDLKKLQDRESNANGERQSSTVAPSAQTSLASLNSQPADVAASSIFDSFDAAPRRGTVPAKSADNDRVQSSIFDDFSPAPQVKPPSLSQGQPESSIFDSFDAVPQKKAVSSTSAMDNEAQSSIFDSFDAAPQEKSIPSTSSTKSQAQSSIFDSFDAAPQKKTIPSTSSTKKQAQSSICDSFGAAPQKKTIPSTSSTRNQAQSSIFDSFDTAPPKKTIPSTSSTKNQSQSSIFDSFDPAPRTTVQSSSIFDGYDPNPNNRAARNLGTHDVMVSSIIDSNNAPQTKQPQTQPTSSTDSESTPKPQEKIAAPLRSVPLLWFEWSQQHLLDISAQRLVRELASIGNRFSGDQFEARLTPIGAKNGSLVPSNAGRMLQLHCDGKSLMVEVAQCLRNVCNICKFQDTVVVKRALQLLWSPHQYQRLCYVILLHLAVKQVDLAEDMIRSTSQALMEKCISISFSNDYLAHSRRSVSHVKTLYLRRLAANLSWQIELCLWLHRGGALPLSGTALNEAICAVRIGLVVASWNQDFECLETMLKQPPDCLIDSESGRQQWTSLKIISSSSLGERRQSGMGTPSGGWEFLVDCRRAEATELLRPRQTGCFIIRPHPDDHGVFTLSFKTNLVPEVADPAVLTDGETKEHTTMQKTTQKASSSKSVKRDDVVQHAIVRLSDSGFRCGSFGPFATLMTLLEAVSLSLPFDLRFDQPPNQGLIKEEGTKPSPNCAFFRKLGLSEAEKIALIPRHDKSNGMIEDVCGDIQNDEFSRRSGGRKQVDDRRRRFGIFFELLLLSEVRKQLSGVAAARYDKSAWLFDEDDVISVDSISDSSRGIGAEQEFASSARILRPLLTWCRVMEIGIVCELSPNLEEVSPATTSPPLALNASEHAIEITTSEMAVTLVGGDAAIRKMIQPGSGVEFRTLRLGDGVESALVVLFEKKEAIAWFVSNGQEKTEEDALNRLEMMERRRVIEPVNLQLLSPKTRQKASETGDQDAPGGTEAEGIRYRLVDPWEVEPLYSREAETRGASLGRNKFLSFSLRRVAASCESVFRSIGGVNLLELWASARGGGALTKAMATVHPPWERAAGGDLQLHDGMVSEPDPYQNSIREHLYRNALYRRLDLPQRFLALIQVELLDLKNLTSPGGSLSLTVYSLLRLKRSRSSSPLTNKARTLDSVATSPMKLGKASGPNAPASWGSLVRFRFPLPEDTTIEGRSCDSDREALFKGPPSVLQVSVYEKKFMSDSLLGGADVKLDGLSAGGQLEEWVPLRTGTDGINWFARIRLTLRFELMCLSQENEKVDESLAPSACLRRIHQLGKNGGATEDIKKSSSTPDLLSYFESMVY